MYDRVIRTRIVPSYGFREWLQSKCQLYWHLCPQVVGSVKKELPGWPMGLDFDLREGLCITSYDHVCIQHLPSETTIRDYHPDDLALVCEMGQWFSEEWVAWTIYQSIQIYAQKRAKKEMRPMLLAVLKQAEDRFILVLSRLAVRKTVKFIWTI